MSSHPLSPQVVQADTTPVTHVRVVVHTLGAAGPNTSDNHWSIYLLHPDGVSSTRINMRAEYDDSTGILEWTKHAYIQTTSAITYWDFPVAAGITVLYFARLIHNLRRDRYEISGGGNPQEHSDANSSKQLQRHIRCSTEQIHPPWSPQPDLA